MTDTAPPLELEALCFSYGERQALRDVTFTVRPGEIFGLLGPNGGGKTTLFKVVTTLLPPGSGRVRVYGLDLPREADRVRRAVGVVFQSPSVDIQLTVRENLMHQGHLYGVRGAELDTRIAAALELVGLTDRARERAKKLSGGMKRRVDIAKGLLHDPRLLLLDEPGTGLDPGARREIFDHLRTLRESRGVSSVLTTHLMEEAERCDRVAILDQGRLVALGTPQELRAAVGEEVITLVPRVANDLAALRARLREELEVAVQSVGGALRIEGIERAEGPALVGRIMSEYGAELASVSAGRPTLEDVFLHETGREFA